MNSSSKRIFKIYSKKKNFKNFDDYCKTLNENKYFPDDKFIFVFYTDSTRFMQVLDPNSFHIFLYRIPIRIIQNLLFFIKNKIPIFFLNTEQLSIPHHLDYILKLPPYIQLLDYSLTNQHILKSKFGSQRTLFNKEIYTLPYSINPKEMMLIPKTKNICMIYPGSKSTRRLQMIQRLRQAGLQIDIIHGWGKERDLRLFQYKILLNIHFDSTYKVFEEIRCNRCIFHKMLVISESSIFEEYNPLLKHMIVTPYDNFVEKVKDVLRNYERYYDECFKEYDENKINLFYKQYYGKFFSEKIKKEEIIVENIQNGSHA